MRSRLDRIRIASPCPITWEQMSGDDSVRFCNHCQLNVYNLSSLSCAEAEALLVSTEGRLCARLYRRRDGTVLTSNCPVGLRALNRRVSQTAAAVFALIGSLSTVAFGQGGKKESCPPQTKITQKDFVSTRDETILAGHVMDSSGAMIPDAKVTLQNAMTKEIQIIASDEEGQFRFVAIPPGKYSVIIERPYFSKYTLKDIEIRNNQATNVDVRLNVDQDSAVVGIIVSSDEVDPPGTTTINQKLLRSLPH